MREYGTSVQLLVVIGQEGLGNVNHNKASVLPAFFGVLSLLLSIAIAAMVLLKFDFAFRELSYVGWALTPLIVFLSLALDFYLQRKGRQNPNFIIKPGYTKVLTLCAYASLIVAGFHIWVIADMLSSS